MTCGTVLSAAFEFDFEFEKLLRVNIKSKVKSKVKSGGQECPPHTSPR